MKKTTMMLEDTEPTTATIEFNYHARGFYCSNCSIGLGLDRKECPCCGAKLINPYEEQKNESSKKTI